MFGLFQTDEQRFAEYRQDQFIILCKCAAMAIEYHQPKVALTLLCMLDKHYFDIVEKIENGDD